MCHMISAFLMTIDFSKLQTHTRPVLRLYRALLHHSDQLRRSSLLSKLDADLLREYIRRSFRRNRIYTSFTRCTVILNRSYEKEKLLRLAAWKHDAVSLDRLRSDIDGKRAMIKYNSFNLVKYRRNPRRSYEVDQKYRAWQRQNSKIMRFMPSIKSKVPGIDDESARALVSEFLQKRDKFLHTRQKRFLNSSPRTPIITYLQGPYNVPIIREFWGQDIKYGLRAYDARKQLQRLVDSRNLAQDFLKYAHMEDTWERTFEHVVCPETATQLTEHADSTYACTAEHWNSTVVNSIHSKASYYKRQKAAVNRELEFKTLETLRNRSKPYAKKWKFSSQGIEDAFSSIQ
ncbi:hypothetical protein V1512DRAFT_265692 [Lipomyces arxii]|uniref:uncharacterized protein n=1 Tax=Lipomyces arxii TaxID=56418 RepID=UPI0034CE569C